MNAAELMREIQDRGLQFHWRDGRVICSAPKGGLTEDIQRALVEHKAMIEATVRQIAARETPSIPKRSHSTQIALSFAQQRLWFLDQLRPADPSYNVPVALRLTGDINVPALIFSVNEIVRRHEILRSHFCVRDGEPIQLIEDSLTIEVPTIDLSSLPQDRAIEEAHRLVNEEARKPFDLTTAPLLRVKLLKLEASASAITQQHIMTLTMHHIVCDDHSVNILIDEFATLYQSSIRNQPSPLRDLRIQYADYAVWQRDSLRGEHQSQQLAYWRRELANAPSVLALPTDRPRPPVSDHGGATFVFRIGENVAQGLRAIAVREKATLFMVFLAAFQILLRHYSGQNDICVGAPITNRNRPDLEGLIGFFTNTIVLRATIGGDPSFRETLEQVKKKVLAAQANQDVPFERIVEELKPTRDVSVNPLFQSMLIFLNRQVKDLKLPGLRIESIPMETNTAKFDLTLALVENDESKGFDATIEYATALFDEETIERMAGDLIALLERIAERPNARLTELTALSSDERHRLLVEWNDTSKSYVVDQCVHQLLETQAARTPDAVAVVFEEQSLTYGELNARANRLAHRLIRLGVKAETVVGICVERSLEMIVSVLGILKAGGAYLPLDPDYPSDRLAYMVGDARPLLVVSQEVLCARLPETVSTLRLDADWVSIAIESDKAPGARVTPQNLAYVIYTSGSTGKPKGVAMPHAPLVNLVLWHTEAYPVPGRTLQFASLGFDVSFQEIFTTWVAGEALVILSDQARKDFRQLLATIDRQNIRRMFMPFAVLQHIAAMVEATNTSVGSLVEVIVAGEQLKITKPLRSWLSINRQCQLVNQYGPTEAHVVSNFSIADLHDDRNPPIGRPISNAKLYILDRNLEPVSIGVIGELYIGGAVIARGYLHNPMFTAERFLPDPFSGSGKRLYRSGDHVRYRKDGNIEFIGRHDHQVKIRGYRVELGEIEAELGRLMDVSDAVIAVHYDAAGERQLIAYVVENEGGALSASQLKEALAKTLPDHMLPSTFVILERLPLTANGKVDREALPTPETRGQRANAYVAPRTATEWLLVREFKKVLGLEEIGIEDSFFDLGGNSLVAIKLIERIRQTLYASLPAMAIFQAPTVAQLAKMISGHKDDEQSLIVQLRAGGDKPPIYCIHPAGGSIIRYQDFADSLEGMAPVYGIQSRRIFDDEHVENSVEEMASHYVEQIRRHSPHGPYFLLGWSSAGVTTLAIAEKLEALREQVAFIGLLDTHLNFVGGGNDIDAADDPSAVLESFKEFATLEGKNADELLNEEDRRDLLEMSDRLTVREQYQYAAIWGQERGFWQGVSRELVDFIYTDTANAIRMICEHDIKKVQAPIHYWAARKSLNSDGAPTSDWSQFTLSSVELEIVDGDHGTIVSDPVVHMQIRDALLKIWGLFAAMRAGLANSDSSLNELLPDGGEHSRRESGAFDGEAKAPDVFSGIQSER